MSHEVLTLDDAKVTLAPCPTGKGGQRRFRALAYTGATVLREYGNFVIDLGGFKQRAQVPMFIDHDPSKIAGYADSMRVTDDGLVLEGVLSSKTSYGKVVQDLADEGFAWQMSVGISIEDAEDLKEGSQAEVNGRMELGPCRIARKVSLMETSFLANGADPNTHGAALARLAAYEEAPVADTRPTLKEVLAKFPEDKALAAEIYAEDGSVQDIQLAIYKRDSEALTALRTEHEALKAEHAALKEKLGTIEALETQAGNPGVGFTGLPQDAAPAEALSGGDKTPTTYEECWAQNEAKLTQEFFDKETFLTFCRVERPEIAELI